VQCTLQNAYDTSCWNIHIVGGSVPHCQVWIWSLSVTNFQTFLREFLLLISEKNVPTVYRSERAARRVVQERRCVHIKPRVCISNNAHCSKMLTAKQIRNKSFIKMHRLKELFKTFYLASNNQSNGSPWAKEPSLYRLMHQLMSPATTKATPPPTAVLRCSFISTWQ